MNRVSLEILEQFQRLRREDRQPAKVQVGMALQYELYQDERLVIGVPYASPRELTCDRILGLPVEYLTDYVNLKTIRVIPETWEGEGQGRTRA